MAGAAVGDEADVPGQSVDPRVSNGPVHRGLRWAELRTLGVDVEAGVPSRDGGGWL